MFDGIMEYLKTNRYPSFIKLTTDKAAAKSEFRRKCSMFFLDKNGDLIQGRAAGVHRNVLRRGELATVFHFIHEALGHCSADVWIYGSAEMEDVLEKLHVAFVHCAVNNLVLAVLVLQDRRKEKTSLPGYEYDVIVQGDINDPSRNFVIKPRGISPEEAEQFMTSVLGSCDGTITLEEAATMADTSNEVSTETLAFFSIG
ncbi:hypothetical protein COOONC_18956 [Cooperia oncophora]